MDNLTNGAITISLSICTLIDYTNYAHEEIPCSDVLV